MVSLVQAGTITDNYNEGHPSWVILQIASAAANSTTLDPTVVLLYAGKNLAYEANRRYYRQDLLGPSLGTNDANIPSDAVTAYLRLGSLIDQLIIEQPIAAILVAKIIPAANNATMATIDAFNAQIAGQPSPLSL